MNILIRKATIDDKEALIELEQTLFNNSYSDTFLEVLLKSESILVACLNKRIVGVVGWLVNDHSSDVLMLGVHHDVQRNNIGMMLMKACISVLINQGQQALFVEVRLSNTPARALYDKLGFEVVKTKVDYYSHPQEDALEMRLIL